MKCDFMFRIGKRDPSLGPSWSEGNLRYEARCIDLRTRQAGYRQPSSGPRSQTRMVHLRVPHRQTDRQTNTEHAFPDNEIRIPSSNPKFCPLCPTLRPLRFRQKRKQGKAESLRRVVSRHNGPNVVPPLQIAITPSMKS